MRVDAPALAAVDFGHEKTEKRQQLARVVFARLDVRVNLGKRLAVLFGRNEEPRDRLDYRDRLRRLLVFVLC